MKIVKIANISQSRLQPNYSKHNRTVPKSEYIKIVFELK